MRSPASSTSIGPLIFRLRTRGSPRAKGRPLARLVAIYRSPSYSPQQHRVNDTAILDATVGRLEAHGWRAIKTTELEVEQGRLPAAELYLNMCQGSLAAEQLMPFESDGVVVVNRASSALNCHRHRLVKRLAESPLAFPRTLIHASSAPLPPAEQLATLSPTTRRSGSSVATYMPSGRMTSSPRRSSGCRRCSRLSRPGASRGWRCRSTCPVRSSSSTG